jgi:hypothetical protein
MRAANARVKWQAAFSSQFEMNRTRFITASADRPYEFDIWRVTGALAEGAVLSTKQTT